METEKMNIDFGKRLAELRMDRGVSARDMSLSLGTSESYINRIETGRMLPSMSAFFYICEYLGVSPAEFFEEELPPGRREMEGAKKLS